MFQHFKYMFDVFILTLFNYYSVLYLLLMTYVKYYILSNI